MCHSWTLNHLKLAQWRYIIFNTAIFFSTILGTRTCGRSLMDTSTEYHRMALCVRWRFWMWDQMTVGKLNAEQPTEQEQHQSEPNYSSKVSPRSHTAWPLASSLSLCHQILLNFALEFTTTETRPVNLELMALCSHSTVPAQLKPSQHLQEGYSIHRGQKLKVRIPFVGQPLPRVIWIKEREVIASNDKFDITQDESSATLVINEVEKSDKGRYIIQVENKLGRDQFCFDVIVTGIQPQSMFIWWDSVCYTFLFDLDLQIAQIRP